MNPKLREDIAKLMYDFGKIVFAAAVIGPFLLPQEDFKWWTVVYSAFFVFMLIVVGGLTRTGGK